MSDVTSLEGLGEEKERAHLKVSKIKEKSGIIISITVVKLISQKQDNKG